MWLDGMLSIAGASQTSKPDLSCSPVALTRTISVLIQPPFQITTPSLFTHPANSHVSLNLLPRLPQVYIDVEDVNDNYPLTSKPVYHAEVMENSEAGTPVAQFRPQIGTEMGR